MKFENPNNIMEDIGNKNKEELQGGAQKIEEINQRLENEELSEKERQDLFNEVVDHEEKLDMLENELGLNSTEASEALALIYEGRINVEEELVLVQEEIKSTGEAMDSALKTMIKKASGLRKTVLAATLLIAIGLGSVTGAMAGVDGEGSMEAGKITNSIELNTKANLALLKLRNGGDSEALATMTKLMVRSGMPKTGETMGDYMDRALEKVNLTQDQINNVIQSIN